MRGSVFSSLSEKGNIVRNIANTKYCNQKSQAKQRGISFELTFEQWNDIWQKSGKWELRGRGRDKYVMSRVADKGGYTLGNVFIQSNLDNVIEGNKNRIVTKETKTKLSNIHKKICTTEHINKMHAARYGHKIKETI